MKTFYLSGLLATLILALYLGDRRTCLAQKQTELSNSLTVQKQKIIKQLGEASKNGVGIKSYQSILSSIDHDIQAGVLSTYLILFKQRKPFY